MAKVKVTFKLKALELLDKFINTDTAKKIGDAVVGGSKDLIDSGQSPVEGVGRFEAYKAQAKVNKLKAKKKVSSKTGRSHHAVKATKSTARAYSKKLGSAIKDAKKGYPYSVMKKYPDKKVRPVNLSLSGKMLSFLGFRVKDRFTIEVGLINAPDHIKTIAKAHNEGPTNNAFPQRKFVPTKDNESYTVSIMRRIRQIFSDRLKEILDESNK